MALNIFWDMVVGPFGESDPRIPVSLFHGCLTDLVMGGGITVATARLMMGLAPGSEEAQEMEDFFDSVVTITAVSNPAFPGGEAQARQLVVQLASSLMQISAGEVTAPGNPYIDGNSIRLRSADFIVQTGGSLVGSMAAP